MNVETIKDLLEITVLGLTAYKLISDIKADNKSNKSKSKKQGRK